jgi:hypothetical protein
MIPENSPRLRGFHQGLAAKQPSDRVFPAHGSSLMFPAVSQLLPAAARFCRQVVPPVVATLIAAGLIQAYNRTFSTHVQQPRMAALHLEANAADGTTAPITTVGMTRPPAPPAAAVTETITIHEDTAEPDRLWDKDAKEEAGKDQTVRLAAEPAPVPAAKTVAQAPRAEPKPEVRAEPRFERSRVAAVELAQPIVRAPAPVIVAVPPSVVSPPTVAPVVGAMPAVQDQRPQIQQAYPPYQVQQPPYQQHSSYPQPQYPQPAYQQPQYPQPTYQQQPAYQPPPVVMGTPPMVTVPDRARPAQPQPQQPIEEAQAAEPRPQGAIGTFVNAFKPSNWFARAREFGDKIEQAGNDILPSIRQ